MPNYFNRSIDRQRLRDVLEALTYEWQTFLELKAKANLTNNAVINEAISFLIQTNQVESIFSSEEIPCKHGITKNHLRNKQKLYRLKVK